MQILYFDWLSYSLFIGDRPCTTGDKQSIFKFKTMTEDSRFPEVSDRFFKIIFCPTSWFILKQLDNLPSLSISYSQLNGSVSLTICSQTICSSLLSNCSVDVPIAQGNWIHRDTCSMEHTFLSSCSEKKLLR